MVELAIEGEPLFELSDHDLVCKGPSYTVDTVAHFHDPEGGGFYLTADDGMQLLVRAKEKKSWFGFGADATVHVWGKPVLDQAQQTLKLAEIELAVESEAAFGLLGAAARQAMPLMQKALAERATIDLKPFATEAREKIASAMAEFRKNEQGVKVDANITTVRLAEIAYDAKTLRIVAEAEGAINVAVTQLPNF